MRRQTTVLVLVLAVLAVPSVGRGQTTLPPPLYGTEGPTPAQPGTPAAPMDREVLASSTTATTAPGLTPPSPPNEPVHVDDRVQRAGYESANATPGLETSAVAVSVEGPAQVTPGEAMACALIVRNPGPQVVAQVRVELTLPDGAVLLSVKPATDGSGPKLSWPIGNLEAGGVRRLELDIKTPTRGELLLRPSVSFAAAVGLRTRLEKPAFAIVQSLPESVHRGDKVRIDIQVTNQGPAPLNNVLLKAQLPEGLRHAQNQILENRIGSIAAGETKKLDLEVQAAQVGRYVSVLSATAEGGVTTTSRATVAVTEPGLTLRLDGIDQVRVGQEADFRVMVSNTCSQRTPPARITLRVPDALEVVAASPGATTDSAHLIAWSLPALEPGTSQSATLRLRPRLPGDWTVEAAAELGGGVSLEQHRTVHAEGAPGLTVEVRLEEDPLAVGDETFLEVRIHNTGAFPAQDVAVTVRLPENVQLVDAHGPTSGRVQGPLLFFEPLPELNPRQRAGYRCRVRGLRPGDQHILAEVLARGLKQPLHNEARCRVFPPATNPEQPR